ncbi:hypothetical protein MTR67_051550 [Solanum verrucosum]|uniref:Uncharacterized protein n=1 Tax=Solanum verrucosum TaxID=315347 RepID=A0AAF0V441_SOLVR|nr:hypothetical protein MTR67_051550 [Solanum verrucosum]
MNVLYHPGKANVVVDALSRLSTSSVSHVEEEMKELAKDVHRLARLGVGLMDMSDGGVIVQNRSESSLVAEVKEKQDSDPILLQLKVEKGKEIYGEEGIERGWDACTIAETSWIHHILRELGLYLREPAVRVLCDNVSSTYTLRNPVFHDRSKHIDVDFHYVRDKVA